MAWDHPARKSGSTRLHGAPFITVLVRREHGEGSMLSRQEFLWIKESFGQCGYAGASPPDASTACPSLSRARLALISMTTGLQAFELSPISDAIIDTVRGTHVAFLLAPLQCTGKNRFSELKTAEFAVATVPLRDSIEFGVAMSCRRSRGTWCP